MSIEKDIEKRQKLIEKNRQILAAIAQQSRAENAAIRRELEGNIYQLEQAIHELNIIKDFLVRYQFKGINDQNEFGQTPLVLALQFKQTDVFDCLIKQDKIVILPPFCRHLAK